MSTKNAERLIDAEAEAALAALRRARLQAERIALITGTCLIQAVDGRPVRVPPRRGLALNDQEDDGPLP